MTESFASFAQEPRGTKPLSSRDVSPTAAPQIPPTTPDVAQKERRREAQGPAAAFGCRGVGEGRCFAHLVCSDINPARPPTRKKPSRFLSEPRLSVHFDLMVSLRR